MPTLPDALAEYARPLRVRQAVLVTALLRLGEPLRVTRRDVTDSAAHDVQVEEDADGFTVRLTAAPGG